MYCRLVIPGLLPPTEQKETFFTGLTLPALARVIARSNISSSTDDSYETWLCKLFSIDKQNDWPVAPITLTTDGGNAANGYWIRADPVHLRANRDQLVMADSNIVKITQEEADELTSTLNAHFHEDGFNFLPLASDRWYLRLPSPIDLDCVSRREAIGKNIDPLLPKGEDGKRFHALLNEIQMLLFSHPLNQQRENAGQLAINSVWFWGGGYMPKIAKPPIARFSVVEKTAQSLAALTSIPTTDLPINADASLLTRQEGEQVIVIDALHPSRQYGDIYQWQQTLLQIEQNWLSPLLNLLEKGKISKLLLTAFGDNHCVELQATKSGLWKFWRNTRQLTDL